MGDEFGLVDVAVAPWALRDYVIRDHRGYKREEVGDGWKEYAERLESRDSVVKTSSVSYSEHDRCLPLTIMIFQEKEYYTEIYGRYLRDEAQSEAAKATRSGKIIP